MNTINRIPPHDLDAEHALLGAMLRDSNLIAEIVGKVGKDDFYLFGHRLVFSAIVELHDDAGGPVDVMTVATLLNARREMDDAGGAIYLAKLLECAPCARVHLQHAQTILRHSVARKVILAGNELKTTGYDPSLTAADLLAESERQIGVIAEGQNSTDIHHIRETVAETWHAIDDRHTRSDARFSGVPSGFIDLDAMTAGFQSGELIIIAARPSCGKTALAINVTRHAAVEANVAVLFLSLEQSRVELTERLLCCQAQADGHRLRTGRARPAETGRLMQAGELLTRTGIYVDDSANQNLPHIVATARRMKRAAGIGLVIIDYLQLIDPVGKRETRQEEVSSQSRRLKLLARELKVPVIVLAQLNREVESRHGGRPKLSDLRESGALEQDADVVMLLHRREEGLVDLILAKQRNGPVGDARLLYVKQHMRFENFVALQNERAIN